MRSAGSRAVEEVLASARPLAEMLWSREMEGTDVSTPERRAALERRVLDAVAPIRDEAVRRHYRSDMEGRLLGLFGTAAPGRQPGRQPWRQPRRDRAAALAPSSRLVTAEVKEGALVRGSIRNRSVLL